MKVEVVVLGSRPSLIVHIQSNIELKRPVTEFTSCMNVEEVVLGSPSLIVHVVSSDVK